MPPPLQCERMSNEDWEGWAKEKRKAVKRAQRVVARLLTKTPTEKHAGQRGGGGK
jgi:hypothetical protein